MTEVRKVTNCAGIHPTLTRVAISLFKTALGKPIYISWKETEARFWLHTEDHSTAVSTLRGNVLIPALAPTSRAAPGFVPHTAAVPELPVWDPRHSCCPQNLGSKKFKTGKERYDHQGQPAPNTSPPPNPVPTSLRHPKRTALPVREPSGF